MLRVDKYLILKRIKQKTGKDSVAGLAKFLDVSPQTMNNWLAGRQSPRLEHVYGIATYVGCNWRDILEELPNPDQATDPKAQAPIMLPNPAIQQTQPALAL